MHIWRREDSLDVVVACDWNIDARSAPSNLDSNPRRQCLFHHVEQNDMKHRLDKFDIILVFIW